MILLGSTGSIGVSTLDVATLYGLKVELLAAGNNTDLLNTQIERFHPRLVVVSTAEAAGRIHKGNFRLFIGEKGLLEALEEAKSAIVLNAIVGFAGLRPTIKALELGKKVALANKESLVVGGKFLDTSRIIPVDSEHFGLWYLLGNRPVSKMVITASGGALRDLPLEALKNVTLEQVLRHPNWSMGQKITIDSATMMNKLFEIIEARWLFGADVSYNAIIETSSLIHAFITFCDGVTTAQLSTADMRLPIAYALLEKLEVPLGESFDVTSLSSLTFRPLETERYPVWGLKETLLSELDLGVIVNGANEAAIELFLAKKIGFTDISTHILNAVEYFNSRINVTTQEDIFGYDKEVRRFVKG